MKTIEAIKVGSNLLRKKRIPSYILDSEILMSKTLNKPREQILINLDKKLSDKKISLFKRYLNRRSKMSR